MSELSDDALERLAADIANDDEETPCPKREDGMHCNCWYDGEKCCACGAGAAQTPEGRE